MIGRQDTAVGARVAGQDPNAMDRGELGGHLIRIGLDVDALMQRSASLEVAVESLEKQKGRYNPKVLQVLVDPAAPRRPRAMVRCNQLRRGMVIEADVLTHQGVVVVRSGTEVTDLVRERLQGFAARVGVQEPIPVLLAADDPHRAAS